MPGTSDHTAKGKVRREGHDGEEEYEGGQNGWKTSRVKQKKLQEVNT